MLMMTRRDFALPGTPSDNEDPAAASRSACTMLGHETDTQLPASGPSDDRMGSSPQYVAIRRNELDAW